MRLARVVPVLATVMSLAITSCAWFREPPIWVVTQVSHHGAYLQAAINTERGGLTFVFEPTDVCHQVLQMNGEVAYVRGGPLGWIERGGARCAPIGVGQFASWVRRFNRPRNLPILPRSEATFRKIGEDNEVILVRGTFPLAGLVGVPGGRDSVAFLPNSEICETYVEQGAGPMLYRRTSAEVIWLGGASTRCPILALARPLEAVQDSVSSDSTF